MDEEDFPRGKRRKLDTDAEAKQVKSTPLDKDLFSEVNYASLCDFYLAGKIHMCLAMF